MARFFRGENDLYKMLKEDHQKIQSTLEQIENSTETERPHLFSMLEHEVIPHLKAEEKIFYPVLRENLRTHEDALESFEEHRIAQNLVNEMRQSGEMDTTWKAKSIVLKTILDHHFKIEESRVFDDASKAIPEDNLKIMARAYQDEKSRLQSSFRAGEKTTTTTSATGTNSTPSP